MGLATMTSRLSYQLVTRGVRANLPSKSFIHPYPRARMSLRHRVEPGHPLEVALEITHHTLSIHAKHSRRFRSVKL